MSHYFQLYLAALAALIPIVNPFSTVPLFLGLVGRRPAPEMRTLVLQVARNFFIVTMTVFFLGSFILEFFSLSLEGIRIAGGLIIVVLGFRMLFPGDVPAPAPSGDRIRHGADVTFVPLTIPSLAGPGTMAIILTGSAKMTKEVGWTEILWDSLTAVAVFLTLAVFVYLVLSSSRLIARKLGDSGIETMKRIMGFLLICIGVEFVMRGVREGFLS
jgi:multiple antibiotic resistance protein